jgi:hypothetical protein
MDLKKLLVIETKEFRLTLYSLFNGEIYPSGYYIEYIDLVKTKSYSAEVLDDDHVWRELKHIGVKKSVRKFVLKYC